MKLFLSSSYTVFSGYSDLPSRFSQSEQMIFRPAKQIQPVRTNDIPREKLEKGAVIFAPQAKAEQQIESLVISRRRRAVYISAIIK